jgi:recombinational DNA repair ATPase RecF
MDGLFMDSAGARRRWLDRMAVALDAAHARHAARYEAALRERNRLLAGDTAPDPVWLDGIEAQMAEAGSSLAGGRVRLVEALVGELEALPSEPFARPDLTLVTGGAPDPDAWRASRGADRAAGRTLAGPHRDDLGVTMAGKGQVAAQCSTGEQKAMLIAVTLAGKRAAARRGGRAPRPAAPRSSVRAVGKSRVAGLVYWHRDFAIPASARRSGGLASGRRVGRAGKLGGFGHPVRTIGAGLAKARIL